MTVAVNRSHAPEVHVSNFQGVRTRHVEDTVAGSEVVVHASVDPHLAKTEVLILCKFKQNLVARSGSRPVQGRLGVAREVVARLVPNRQTVGRGREVDRSRWRSTSPFVGDGKRRSIAARCSLGRVEDDAFAVGVGFKLSTHSNEQIKRVVVSAIKVVLHGMVHVEGEGVARLVAVRKSDGGRSV